MKYALILCLLASPALAADAPTVTLTQDQLSRLIQSEQAKAVANYASQAEAAKAKDVYDAVQKAFAPKPGESK